VALLSVDVLDYQQPQKTHGVASGVLLAILWPLALWRGYCAYLSTQQLLCYAWNHWM